MPKAIIKTATAPLYQNPGAAAPLQDEVLLGMVVEVLSAPQDGWLKVRTAYRYEGFVAAACLENDDTAAREWDSYGKMVARAPFVDVMEAADAKSRILLTAPRGALLHPQGGQDAEGWVAVGLPGGGAGYVKNTNLMPHITHFESAEGESLRDALATSAMSYLGTQYRFGGKTPAGIDCSGLVSMAYLLNGATIWRDGAHQDGFDTHLIEQDALGMGDVIYFDGHVAMYIGDGMFIHATGQNGSDGVVLNSLRPESPFYRKDLAGSITACASLF